MKQNFTPPVRAALFLGAALLSTPAFAQQGQNVTPPPVVPTVPQSQIVTPPPVVPTAQPAPTVQIAPSTPVVQAIPETTVEEAAPARSVSTTARRTVTRTTRTAPVRAAAPARPATPPVEAPAPATAPVQTAVVPAPAPETAPVPAPVEEPAAATTSETRAMPIWPWLAGGGLLLLAALAFLMFRRRTEYDEYAEETYETAPVAEPMTVEPVAAAPIAAAPVMPRLEPEVAPRAMPAMADADVEPVPAVVAAEDATIAEADAIDLAGVTAGSAPVSQRPWLELGMRPIRAGTMADEALVEFELIVSNSGDMAAKDVRISTFMLPGGVATSEMEQMLVDHANDSAVEPVSIEPGEGKCVDATLAVHKAGLQAQEGDSFSPVVVADARYRLPDGSEGRTSASFRLGLTDEDGNGIAPIGIDRHGMHDNVVAELEGAPARA